MQIVYTDLTEIGRKLVDEINEHMQNEMYSCIGTDFSAIGRFKLGSTYIDIDYSQRKVSETAVMITAATEREYPRIEEFIAHHLPDWGEVELKAERDRADEEEFQRYLWDNCRYW